jgi:hypothetical protein
MPFMPGRTPDTSICTLCSEVVVPPLGHTLAEAEARHQCSYQIAVSLPFFEPWEEIAAILKEENDELRPKN